MFGARQHKISIDHELHERLQKAAQIAGYSSADEFIEHILESAAPATAAAESEEEVRKRLKGLGYLE
jgi:metal-responsive CopG/Arc/MetJ family transcriptional regulator